MNYLDVLTQDPHLLADMANEGLYLSIEDGRRTLSYHIHDEVGPPNKYTRFLELTRCLDEDDFLEIIISGSPGGYLSGARVVTTAMDSCPAMIDCVVIDSIASAATMIALNGDNLVMTEGSSMMLHNASYGTGGKASDIASHVEFANKDITETMEHYYLPFLKRKELKRLLKGEELWLDADSCKARWDKVSQKREKAALKHQKQQWAEQKILLEQQIAQLDEALGS